MTLVVLNDSSHSIVFCIRFRGKTIPLDAAPCLILSVSLLTLPGPEGPGGWELVQRDRCVWGSAGRLRRKPLLGGLLVFLFKAESQWLQVLDVVKLNRWSRDHESLQCMERGGFAVCRPGIPLPGRGELPELAFEGLLSFIQRF